MKTWFKHSTGYVNLDSQNLYLTNTGNWSDTDDLNEKGVQPSGFLRRFGLYLFVGLSVIGLTYLFVRGILGSKLGVVSVLGAPLLAYALIKYLSPALGACFKIPLNKITRIDIEDKIAYLSFLNGKNQPDYTYLRNLDDKGLEVLAELIK